MGWAWAWDGMGLCMDGWMDVVCIVVVWVGVCVGWVG